MSETIEARVQQKTDTEANWLVNPLLLLPGEQAFVSDASGEIPTNFKLNTYQVPKLFSELPYYFDASIRVPMFQGATPSGNPDPATGNGFWIVTEAGTYTNFGGVVLPDNSFGIITRLGTSYQMLVTTISTAGLLPSGPYSGTAVQLADSIQQNNIFKNLVVDSAAYGFLLDAQFFGNISVPAGSKLYLYQINRNYEASAGVFRWLVSFAIYANGGLTDRVCQFLWDGYTEPVADANGRQIATLKLDEINSSGITASVTVDWSKAATGSVIYGSVSDTTAISPNRYENQIVKKEIVKLRKNDLFVGAEADPVLMNFLLDLELSNINLVDTDVLHIHYAWRGYPNPTDPTWVFAVGINGTRVATATLPNYTEPAADDLGRRIATLNLTPVGSYDNNTNVSGRATVDWAVLTSGIQYYNDTVPARPTATLAKSRYMPKLPSIQAASLLRVSDNNMFVGDSISSVLPGFLLDVQFSGDINIPDGGYVYLFWIYRNYAQAAGVQRWIVAFGIYNNGGTGDRICQYLADNKTEPAAVNGRRIEKGILCSEINNSGITARITVDWAAIPEGVTSFNAGSPPNSLKSKMSAGRVLRQLAATSVEAKTDLPTSTVPHRIYTVLNDVDAGNVVPSGGGNINQMAARNYSLALYVDRFLFGFPLNTGVRWDRTGTDQDFVASPRKNDFDTASDHPTPSTTIAKSYTLNGGETYNNRAISFTQVSTRESTGASALVANLVVGDSFVEGLMTNEGLPAGMTGHFWAVSHEQFQKCRIDYLLSAGYTAAQIMAGEISTADAAKYQYVGVGTRSTAAAIETYSITYRGVNLGPFTVKAEGRGGWNTHAYLNKPTLFPRAQGGWDFLGLGDGTGTDYTGSQAQWQKMYATPWNPDSIIDTTAMRSYVTTNFGYTGSTLADYKTWALSYAQSPVNPFYDHSKAETITDSTGQVWTVRFSISKYLERYRTMDNSGVRLSNTDASKGTAVTDTTAWDVMLPTHVVLNTCQNDENVECYGRMFKVFADSVKDEYSDNNWGTVNIALSVADGSGTYFPQLYPQYSDSAPNEWERVLHNDNLQRALTAITNEDTNRVFVLPSTFIIPTAESLIARQASSPQADITGNDNSRYYIPSRTSPGIKAHLTAAGYRAMGIHLYNWIKYTLGL